MMQKYFIGIISTISLLGSCSDNDVSGQLPEEAMRVPMSFSVSQEPLSRISYVNSISDLTSFGVAAQIEDDLYFCHHFNGSLNEETGEWVYYPEPGTTEVNLFWPGDDRTVVDFYAMNDYEGFPSLFYNYSTGEDRGLTDHAAELYLNDYYKTSDIVAAYASMKRPDDNTVRLSFKHIMAELGILVRGEEHIEQNGSDSRYYLSNIIIKGNDRKIYHFDTNEWSDTDNSETFDYYFFSSNGYEVGFDYVSIPDDGDYSTSKYIFLFPGSYTIEAYYNSMHGWTSKSTDVTLIQGQKNRVYLTLPYYVNPDLVN